MKKIIFFLLFSTLLKAQNYTVELFNFGNSATPIQDIHQIQSDSNNAIWLSGLLPNNGGYSGLVKYSGNNQWQSYTTSNSGILSNQIKRIRSVNGKVWALHNNGISKFDGTTWTTYTSVNEQFLESQLIDFAVTPDEKVWVIGMNSNYPVPQSIFLLKYDGTSWTRYFDGIENANLLHYINEYSSKIEADENNKIWISMSGYQIILGFNGSTWDYETLNSPYSSFPLDLKLVKNGFFYFGYPDGDLYKYNINTNIQTPINANCNSASCLTDIEATADGKIWSSMIWECGGIIRLLENCQYFSDAPNSPLSFHSINSLTADSLGNLYGGTTNGMVKISISNVLSVDDEKHIKFSIFPNPAQDELNINANAKIKEIQILGIDGKLIKKIDQNFEKIDVKSLTKGLYFLKITTGNETYNEKFIKN